MVAERFLTTAELAEKAGVPQHAIQVMCAANKLPAIKKGNMYLIPLEAANAFLRVREARKQLRELTERFYAELSR